MKKNIIIELDEKYAEKIKSILEKQLLNTKWVLENKNPLNKDELEIRVESMEKVIEQIETQSF